MKSYKVRKFVFLSFPWKRESSLFNRFRGAWIPAYAGMTTFYENINIEKVVFGLTKSFLRKQSRLRRDGLPFSRE